MLAPPARSRAQVGVAVLLAAAAGSLGLAGGTSSATGPAGATTRTYGPVAALPPPALKPLLRATGPVPLGALPVPLRPTGPATPTAGAPVGPPPVVGPGSSPRRVREIQRLLNARGAQLRVDGAWGPATTRAVEAAQQQFGLPVDGRAGPATAAALRR